MSTTDKQLREYANSAPANKEMWHLAIVLDGFAIVLIRSLLLGCSATKASQLASDLQMQKNVRWGQVLARNAPLQSAVCTLVYQRARK